jgi:hypothetical protein
MIISEEYSNRDYEGIKILRKLLTEKVMSSLERQADYLSKTSGTTSE